MKELFKLISETKTMYGFDKAKLLLLIGECPEDRLEGMLQSAYELQNPKTGDLQALNLVRTEQLQELLNDFWQRSSDACPLDATESENQICEWKQWICDTKVGKFDNI